MRFWNCELTSDDDVHEDNAAAGQSNCMIDGTSNVTGGSNSGEGS